MYHSEVSTSQDFFTAFDWSLLHIMYCYWINLGGFSFHFTALFWFPSVWTLRNIVFDVTLSSSVASGSEDLSCGNFSPAWARSFFLLQSRAHIWKQRCRTLHTIDCNCSCGFFPTDNLGLWLLLSRATEALHAHVIKTHGMIIILRHEWLKCLQYFESVPFPSATKVLFAHMKTGTGFSGPSTYIWVLLYDNEAYLIEGPLDMPRRDCFAKCCQQESNPNPYPLKGLVSYPLNGLVFYPLNGLVF